MTVLPKKLQYTFIAVKSPGFWKQFRKPEVYSAYLFLAPALIGLLVFNFIPFFSSFYYSFTKYNVLSEPEWKGLQNYVNLFDNKYFWQSLWNTAYYTIGTIPPKLILGLMLALLLNRGLRGIAFFRAMFYSPVVTAMVAVSVVWLWIYNPSYGYLNMILKMLGLPAQLWLLSPQLAMPSLMVMGVWKWTGQTMLIYLAGLQGIPSSIYEASDIDGANSWQKLWYITIPLLRPMHLFNVVTMAISSFQVFDQIYVMTEGGPGFATTTVVYEIYREAFQKFNMGYASAIAMVLFVIIMALTLINLKVGKGDIEY